MRGEVAAVFAAGLLRSTPAAAGASRARLASEARAAIRDACTVARLCPDRNPTDTAARAAARERARFALFLVRRAPALHIP